MSVRIFTRVIVFFTREGVLVVPSVVASKVILPFRATVSTIRTILLSMRISSAAWRADLPTMFLASFQCPFDAFDRIAVIPGIAKIFLNTFGDKIVRTLPVLLLSWYCGVPKRYVQNS